MRFLVYALRWQLSGFVIAPAIMLIGDPVWSAIGGNLAGACIFWWVDKVIFGKRVAK